MNPELKAKWIADLRTNPDLQGQEAMRTENDKFCCLGRLCEVANIRFDVKDRQYVFPKAGGYSERRFNGEFPTHVLVDKLGISIANEAKLMEMNDNEQLTFAEIADWIEENL